MSRPVRRSVMLGSRGRKDHRVHHDAREHGGPSTRSAIALLAQDDSLKSRRWKTTQSQVNNNFKWQLKINRQGNLDENAKQKAGLVGSAPSLSVLSGVSTEF